MSFFKLDSTDPDHENVDIDLSSMEASAIDDGALETKFHALTEETEEPLSN